MIRDYSLESLKAKVDIVDILGDHIELKKAGANFKACCPFHGESTASFVVSPKKQIAHCFGCGYTGDAIKFIQDLKKLSFVEAVEDIANSMNFTLEYDEKSSKKNYSKVMESMNSFYISHLDQTPHEYLLSRGITGESIKNFEIGFAPSSAMQIEHINREVLNASEAIECGVLASDEGGKSYARLTNRISFPIRNHTGKLIGFGGRILNGERAKYLNSPQTPLFDKSRNLYGYNLAKEYIYKNSVFTIVEGYLDVVMFHQSGIRTAVATMGTALTEMHCNTIAKAGARARLCYDGDKAGIEAAFKASKLLSAHNIFGGVVLFPEGKDPADMIKEGKKEELVELIKKPTPLIEFVITRIASMFNLSEPNKKQEALKEVQAFLNTLTPLIQDEYRTYVAKVLNINATHIQVAQTPQTQEVIYQCVNISEMNIINTATATKELRELVLDELTPEMFVYHRREFIMLKEDNQELLGLLLRDELSIYSIEELRGQIRIMKIAYHEKQLKSVIASSWGYDRKAFEIKKIKGIVFELKKKRV